MDLTTLENQNAIISAKEVFWRQGYDKTAVADLVKATGFNRYKLYNAFDGKLGIFLAVLDQYYLERKMLFMEGLANPDLSPIEAIRRVIEFAIDEMADREMGCLLCNVASEGGHAEPAIAERINIYLEEINFAHTSALERAQERGELNPAITPEQGAKLLIALKLGSGARVKQGATREELYFTMNAALAAISTAKVQ